MKKMTLMRARLVRDVKIKNQNLFATIVESLGQRFVRSALELFMLKVVSQNIK